MRLRRGIKGAKSRIAQNSSLPLFQGTPGVWLAALAVVMTVKVEVPLPPAASVTGVAVAVTAAAVPLVVVTLVANEIAPAKLLEFRFNVTVALLPRVMETPVDPLGTAIV